jgi:hypothetical protein
MTTPWKWAPILGTYDSFIAAYAVEDAARDQLRRLADNGDRFAAEFLRSGMPNALTVEVLRGKDTEKGKLAGKMAVLISVTPNRADGIGQLSCVLALCNDPVLADLAREYGFPVVEADLVYDSGRLQAKVGLFADGSRRDPEGIREALLITFAGITDFNEHKGEQLPWPSYMQRASSPDPDRCAAELRVIDSGWPTVPAKVERVPKTKAMRLTFERVRFPNLSFLLHAEAMPKSVMSRLVDLPPPPQAPPKASARIPQATVFGPAFRFKNVEIIGFRIDASRIGPDANVGILLERLRNPPDGTTPPEDNFEYRLATRTIIVELLRYGEMQSIHPRLPIRAQDYMSQHELLIRVLVGRVDDDTSQARAPAVFVPTIFVDNPWTKAVGRELLGFPKELTQFCVDRGADVEPLSWDGYTKGENPEKRPLYQVSQVRVVRNLNETTTPTDTLLKLNYSTQFLDDRFERFDLTNLFSTALVPSAPWRQFDFNERAFRRSFARDVLANGFARFGSIQRAPVDHRDGTLLTALITGSIVLNDIETQFPSAVASLTFNRPHGMRDDHPWARLHHLLGKGAPDTKLDLPTGSWYRLRCSMDLTIDNGLDW